MSLYTLEDVLEALRMADIHARNCPVGMRNYRQKRTEMWISPEQFKCECWVDNPYDIPVESE